MRFTIALLLCLSFSAGFTQSNVMRKPISIDVSSAELEKVLKLIEARANISFAYKVGVVDENRKVTLHVKHMALEDILKIVLYDDGAKFTTIGTQVIIYQQNREKVSAEGKRENTVVRDTIWTQIVNTKFVTDTNRLTVTDTITIFDTVEVKIVKREVTRKAPKTKLNLVSLSYGFDACKFDLGLPSNPYLAVNTTRFMTHTLNLWYGKTAKNFDLAGGLGFSITSESIALSNTRFLSSTRVDSTVIPYTRLDSGAIILPGIDTLWIYKERQLSRTEYDTITTNYQEHEKISVSNTLQYLTIPLSVAYRVKISKKCMLLLAAQVETKILVSKKYKAPIYTNAKISALKNLAPAPALVVASAGVGVNYSVASNLVVYILPRIGTSLAPTHANRPQFVANPLQMGCAIGVARFF